MTIRERNLIVISVSIMILLVLISYWRIGSLGFNFVDDIDYVVSNKHVVSGISLKNISWAFQPTLDVGNWHPLTWITHMLDVDLCKLNPSGHHMTNLLIHIINSLLLFILMMNMTKRIWESYFVSCLFAIHPIHVESVAWISERKDLLCAMFYLLSIMSYYEYTKSKSRQLYILTLFLFLCALMSKPMAVTLPFLLLLLDYWPIERLHIEDYSANMNCNRIINKNILNIIFEKIPLIVMSLIASAITYMVQRDAGAVSDIRSVTLIDRFSNAVTAYGMYLYNMIWPLKLSFFYPYPDDPDYGRTIFILLILFLISIIACSSFHKRKYIFVGWFWYLGLLIPVIGIVQVGAQSMADRYTYLPLIGIFIIVSWGMSELLKNRANHRMLFIYLMVFITLMMAIATDRQLSFWESNLSLMKRSIDIIDNDHPYGHFLLGVAYEGERNYKQAEKHYKIALMKAPKHIETNLKLANLYYINKIYNKSEIIYNYVLMLEPNNIDALNGLGNIMQEYGKFDVALEKYHKALNLMPDKTSAAVNLAIALYRKGDRVKAEYNMLNLLKENYNDVNVLNQLAIMMMKNGRMNEALAYFRRGLILNNNDVEIKKNVGTLFIINGSPDLARNMYEEILLKDPNNIEVNYECGVAYMMLGKMKEAKLCMIRTLIIDESHKKAHHLLSIILSDEGKYEAAKIHENKYLYLKKSEIIKEVKMI